MKKLHALLVLIFLSFQGMTQSPSYEWIGQVGSDNYDTPRSIVADPAGNVFITGAFQGSSDFDPGPGEFLLESNGSSDIFIQKLDPSGNLLWVKQIGGSGSDFGYDISFDQNGNVFCFGHFRGTVDFDPGLDVMSLNSNGNNDAFILKLDADGNLIWAKAFGGTESEFANDFLVDPQGNLYMTGRFKQTVDFDPGPEIVNKTSNGDIDIYILKMDNDGNLLWAQTMGGEENDIGNSLALDAFNNIYITGTFRGLMDFNPDEQEEELRAAYGYEDIFIQKFDTNGNHLWVKQIGGNGSNCSLSRITCDRQNNIILTGTFQQTVDLDPGAGIQYFSAEGLSNYFIEKINGNGELIWVKVISGDHDISGHNVTTDMSNNIYAIGHYRGTADFDPNEATQFQTAIDATSDIFILNLDIDGNLQWVETMGGEGADLGYGIYSDKNGNIYATGNFQETVDFGSITLESFGSADGFIVKLDNSLVSTSAIDNIHFKFSPNPTNGLFNIQFESEIKNVKVAILDIQGRLIQSNDYGHIEKIALDVNQPVGIYFVIITTPLSQKTIKLIKQN